MSKMKKFMAVHRDPEISWEKVENNWAKSASVESATWIRTYFNRNEGVRYCTWMASDLEQMKSVFNDLGVTYESLLEVEETVPDLWGKKWEEHLAADAKSDTLGF